MKRIIAATVLALSALSAHAQQQMGILTSQIPLRGTGVGNVVDVSTLRYINFTSDAHVIDYDGVRVNGSMSLSKLQGMEAWKNYIIVTPLLYLNTTGVRFKCQNGQTLLHFSGRGVEARNDNCSLYYKVVSQSDTN